MSEIHSHQKCSSETSTLQMETTKININRSRRDKCIFHWNASISDSFISCTFFSCSFPFLFRVIHTECFATNIFVFNYIANGLVCTSCSPLPLPPTPRHSRSRSCFQFLLKHYSYCILPVAFKRPIESVPG